MLRISKFADYACVVMIQLAKQAEGVSATELAGQTHLRLPTVRKVLKMLAQAELVTAVRGVRGGYQLKSAPAELSILHIVEAVDGPLALTDCSRSLTTCEMRQNCKAQVGWQLVNQIVRSTLKGRYLQEWLS